jgi:hypothetical protein
VKATALSRIGFESAGTVGDRKIRAFERAAVAHTRVGFPGSADMFDVSVACRQ